MTISEKITVFSRKIFRIQPLNQTLAQQEKGCLCLMKDNVRDFKVYKGKGETPFVFLPRFIRDVRTTHSERYSIIIGEDFDSLGTLDLHISDTIHATLVIVPDIDQDTMKFLVHLIRMELMTPLELDIESFNIFKGVSDCLVLDEDDFYDEDDNEDKIDDDNDDYYDNDDDNDDDDE